MSRWSGVNVSMGVGWKARLREALRLLAIPVEAIRTGPTTVTFTLTTTRSADEVEEQLRAQLMFPGWMAVELADESDCYED